MVRRTTQELSHQIEELDDKVDSGFKEFHQDFKEVGRRFERMEETAAKYRHEIRDKLKPLYTFMDKQRGFNEGYEKAKSDASIKSQIKSGNITVPGQLVKLLGTIFGVLGTLATIIWVLVNANT